MNLVSLDVAISWGCFQYFFSRMLATILENTGKENIQIKVFSLQNLPCSKIIFILKGVTHRIQLLYIWFRAKCICRDFWAFLVVDPEDPRMTGK